MSHGRMIGGVRSFHGGTNVPAIRGGTPASIVAIMRSRVRFIIAISLAAVLGGWLLWVSLGGAMETYTTPSQLTGTGLAAGETYRLNGEVKGAVPDDATAQARSDAGYRFVVADKEDPSKTVEVLYRGTIPDQFKNGREIVVTGTLENGTFVAKRDSLLALCPSKFTAESDVPTAP